MLPTPEHHNTALDASVNLHYLAAGAKHLPTILLLHGFLSSSAQSHEPGPIASPSISPHRVGLPRLRSDHSPAEFAYTFENLANATIALLAALQIKAYAMYVFDHGAAVGWRLASSAITAIVGQNGNTYNEGFGQPVWQPIIETWTTNNSDPARGWLRDNYLTLAATDCNIPLAFPKPTCLSSIHPTGRWIFSRKSRATRTKNVSSICPTTTDAMRAYPSVHEYFCKSQVPLLAIWGEGDPMFTSSGAEAFRRDLPNAVIKFVDAGHFALQTKR